MSGARRPLRIGYLLGHLRPGGAEQQMLLLAERLPRDRFEVEFLSVVGPGIWDERARAVGAGTICLGTPPEPGWGVARKLGNRWVKTVRYLSVARRRRYDIIDAWLFPADLLAASARWITRTPIIISGRRNVQPHEQFGVLSRPLDAFLSRFADAVVANSAAAAAVARSSHGADPRKLRIIRNGVALAPTPTRAEVQAARVRMGVGEADLVIGCVANYLPIKRHDLLLDAFADVVSSGTRARLVLVGDGPMRSNIEWQAKALGIEHLVRLHGTEPNPLWLYPGFDLVVQSSRGEGLPNAILEAASAGRPIVATAAGGTGEIVLDGQTGLLVPVNDRAALSTAMCRAIADPELRRSLGGGARRHIESTFGMDRFVREFATLYEEMAQAKGVQH